MISRKFIAKFILEKGTLAIPNPPFSPRSLLDQTLGVGLVDNDTPHFKIACLSISAITGNLFTLLVYKKCYVGEDPLGCVYFFCQGYSRDFVLENSFKIPTRASLESL